MYDYMKMERGFIMLYESKNVVLKNGVEAVFRSPEGSDAKAMNKFLKTCFSETEFLMRYPEECTESEETEAKFLESIRGSEYTLMIVCTIDGEIAGNCTLMLNRNLKTKHRAELAIGILQKYWGIGIGTTMLCELFSVAKEKGILQLELGYVEGNERACGLYEKMGFVHTGEKPDAIRLKDGTMLKEFSMVKKL